MEKRCSAMRRHSGWMELNPSFLIEAIILFRGCPIFTRLSLPLGLGLGRTRSARARALSPSDADRENISTFIFFPFCLFFWVFFPEEGDHFIIRIYSLSEKKSLRDFPPFAFTFGENLEEKHHLFETQTSASCNSSLISSFS